MSRTLNVPALRITSIVPLAFLLAACSSSEKSGDGTTPPTTTPPDEKVWTMLAQKDWTLPAGQEYPDLCAKQQLTRDIYVSAIRPVHPRGTHHTFVALSDTNDGERCTSAVTRGTLIYAAGVGSEGLTLPEGVGLKLPAGKFLNLSLHLYNATTEELRGTSGIEMIEMAPSEVVYESSTLLAGPVSLQIPPGRTTIKHDCSLQEETSAFAIFPHMHQLGRHLKTTVSIGGQTKVLHDADYDFEEQRQIPIDLLHFQTGDTISTECTYENPGPNTVTFGESSDTEMCFSVMFRYPSTGLAFCLPAR